MCVRVGVPVRVLVLLQVCVGEGMMPVPKRTSQDIQHQQMYLVSARVRFYVDQISHGTSEDRGLNPGL